MLHHSGPIAVVVTTAAASVSAEIPSLDFTLSTGRDTVAFSDDAPTSLFSTWLYADRRETATTELGYAIFANQKRDSLLFTFQIVNRTSSLQTYTLDASLPVDPLIGTTYVGGSVAGLVTDANRDGAATLTTAGDAPLLQGLIDGQRSLSLIDTPLAASAPFLGGTGVIAATSAGLPGLEAIYAGNAMLSDIGVRLTFTLTPGDSAILGGVFVARSIPAPATIAMLILIGSPARRRRDRS